MMFTLVRLLVAIALATVCIRTASAQVQIRSMTDLVDRWIAERSRCFSYSVLCNCSKPLPAWTERLKGNEDATEIETEVERMTLAKHALTVVRAKRSDGTFSRSQFFGASLRCRISGFSDENVSVGYTNAVPDWATDRPDLFLFDPLAVGIGNSQDLANGTEHIKLLGSLRRATTQRSEWILKNYGEKLVATCETGIIVVAHRDQGYMPVEWVAKFEDGRTEQWNVKYIQVNSVWVPSEATLQNSAKGSPTQKLTLSFAWKNVNQELKTGLGAAEQLGRRFSIDLFEY